MDKKTAPASQNEAKLQGLGAAPAEKKDPLSDAKKAFGDALEKTKAQAIREGEIIETPKPEKKKAEIKSEVKPEVKPEPDRSAELAALKAELAEMRKQLQPKAEPKPAPQPAKDFDAVQAELSEHFGEDEGKILTGALKALLEPREQRISQLESLIQKAVEQSKVVSAKSNKARLKEEYPSLAEDEAWEIVQERAQRLVADGKFLTADEAYESVAKALYGKPAAKAQFNEEAEEEASRIAASTPTQPNSARRERRMNGVEKSRAIFDHLFKNPEDAAGAKKLARELNIPS